MRSNIVRNLLFFGIFLLSGCGAGDIGLLTRVDRAFDPAEITMIHLEIYAGQLNVIGVEGHAAVLDAAVSDPADLVVEQQGSEVFISLPASGRGDQLTLRLSPGMNLKIVSFSGDLLITDYSGQLRLSTTAGDVQLNSFDGEGFVRAGRGDVEVQRGQGTLVLIGEHGALSVREFDGDVSITTIMGTIHYAASGDQGGAVRLESDHGPVDVQVSEDTDFEVRVNTTNGEVTCVGEELRMTISGCEGVIGEGGGEMTIRTVSGRVDLRVLSAILEEKND